MSSVNTSLRATSSGSVLFVNFWCFSRIALRKAKIIYNFGLSECSRYTILAFLSAVGLIVINGSPEQENFLPGMDSRNDLFLNWNWHALYHD